MKIKFVLLVIVLSTILCGNIFSQLVLQSVKLDGNTISAYFVNTGIFDQNINLTNSPGFEWPKNSGKYAIFTTGLCIAGRINGELAESMASYKGEFGPGYVLNGVAYTNSNFKIYKISRGDNSGSNPDYANWPLMIPYGAPYIDVNNNHQYDPGVDSIGIRNAVQVIFICLTDGFDYTHSSGEGFGGGITNPKLFSQIAMTAWCYDRVDLKDMQFIKWAVINKGLSQWNSTFFSIVCDPDLGGGNDDYIGCDTSKKLGYCYNADNNDPQYGANPPAVGIIFHKSPFGMTSFNFFNNASPVACENDPNGEPNGAYLFMKGFKKDSSNYMNPMVSPPVPTKFVYTGDPETNTGWTEYRGCVQNCGGNTGPILSSNPAGDRRFIMSSGAENYTVNPGDTVIFYASQLIARGSTNLNSVTLLKNYANVAWSVYNGGFSVGVQNISSNVPSSYSLSQNYPNPFNSMTNVKFSIPENGKWKMENGIIALKIYDIQGKEVATLVNEKLNPGTYEVNFDASNLTSGIYFYRLLTDGFSETRKMVLLK